MTTATGREPRLGIFPPERRIAVGTAPFACQRTCQRFTRHPAGKGGCPGYDGQPGDDPLCLNLGMEGGHC